MNAQQLPSYIERPTDAADIFAIWPGTGVPPGSEERSWHEQMMQAPGSDAPDRMVRNVVIPTVTMFRPAADRANGTALIVAPGGVGYTNAKRHGDTPHNRTAPVRRPARTERRRQRRSKSSPLVTVHSTRRVEPRNWPLPAVIQVCDRSHDDVDIQHSHPGYIFG